MGLIVSMIMLVLIFCLFSLTVYAVIVKDGGNIVYLFDRGRLVIVSNSMSSIADEKDYYNQLVEHGGYLTPEMVEKQFARGDILYFNPAPSLEDLIDKDEHGQPYLTQNGATIGTTYASKYLNKVFAFKYGDMVLVHRLVSIKQITNHEGGQEFMFVFMGDLYPTQTQMVSYDKIEGVATGEIIRKLGFPILFLSSVFGIYTIIVSVGIMVVTNVTAKRIEAEYNNRLVVLGLKPEQTNKKQKLTPQPKQITKKPSLPVKPAAQPKTAPKPPPKLPNKLPPKLPAKLPQSIRQKVAMQKASKPAQDLEKPNNHKTETKTPTKPATQTKSQAVKQITKTSSNTKK